MVAEALTSKTGAGCGFPAAPREAAYPYGSAQFTRLIADSFATAGKTETREFYQWMEAAYRASSARLPLTRSS